MSLAAGARLGPYEVLGLIGAGGMGEVYKAKDTRLDRTVAIKLLPEDLTGDVARVQRFEQEARVASALSHPNVCTIFALGKGPEGRRFIAMEYVDGQTLRPRRSAGPHSVLDALDIAIQIAAGISAAHAVRVLHRDLKPENVLIRSDNLVKVVDFGLAKLLPAGSLISGPERSTVLSVKTDAGTVMG
jgi:eukaryotic-like serine/threonine-protein kinase